MKKANEYDVGEPRLLRKRKMPKRFEEEKAAHEFPQTEKDLYRKRYFEAYRKIPIYSDTQKFVVTTLKFELCGSIIE